MVVDNHGFMVDLSEIEGTLLDSTIHAVTWGPMRDGVEMREGGSIIRQDGSRQLFWDPELLKPYLDACAGRSCWGRRHENWIVGGPRARGRRQRIFRACWIGRMPVRPRPDRGLMPMIHRYFLFMGPLERRNGWKIASGYFDWPSYSVWIIPGTIDLLA
jgi:hypothetical protein